jgi:HPt (histidine-containing phosphotransfer) domain-containing protein
MAHEPRLYSLDRLHEIDNTNKEFIKEIISAFVSNIPLDAKELVKAANEKKWDKVHFIAHKMKANIDLLNIKSVKDEIRFVERNAKINSHPEEIINKANFINITIQKCAKEMQSDLCNSHLS